MKRSTHICKNCGAETTYWTEKPQGIKMIPTINCPVCGAIVAELTGAELISSFKKKAWD